MRRPGRVTAISLSVILAISIVPGAADAAAIPSSEATSGAVLDLGDDIVTVLPPTSTRTKAASRALSAAATGTPVIHTIDISVATVAGSPTVTVPTTDEQAAAFVDQLNDYWSAESNGAIRLEFGKLETRVSTAACQADPQFEDAQSNAFGGEYSGYKWYGTFHHLLSLTTRECTLGLAYLGGNGGIILSGAGSSDALGVPVALHEFGHNLGFAHANAAICATESYDASDAGFGTPGTPNACEAYEYADFLDIMGYSVSGSNPHLSSPQKDAAGWITGMTTVTSTTTQTIQPYGSAASTRTLKVIDPEGETYYIEYRTPDVADSSSLELTQATTCSAAYLGYQRCWGSTTSDGGVRIVRPIYDGHNDGTSVLAVGPVTGQLAATKRDTHLDAGESFTNYDNDFSIAVNSVSPTEGASITVSFAGTAVAPEPEQELPQQVNEPIQETAQPEQQQITLVVAAAATKVTTRFATTKVKRTKKAVVAVTVSGSKPTGRLTVFSKGKKIATATLTASSKGTVKITLPTFKRVGKYTITVKYSGSAKFSASTSKVTTLTVIK